MGMYGNLTLGTGIKRDKEINTGWSEKNGCFSQSNNYVNIEGEIKFNVANYRGEHAVLRVLRLFHRSCFYCHVNTVQSQRFNRLRRRLWPEV